MTLHFEVIRNMIASIAMHCRLRLEMHLVGVEGVIFANFKFDFDGLRDVDEVLFAVIARQSILFGAKHLI